MCARARTRARARGNARRWCPVSCHDEWRPLPPCARSRGGASDAPGWQSAAAHGEGGLDIEAYKAQLAQWEQMATMAAQMAAAPRARPAPISFEDGGARYVFDANTGFFVDTATGFYYDTAARMVRRRRARSVRTCAVAADARRSLTACVRARPQYYDSTSGCYFTHGAGAFVPFVPMPPPGEPPAPPPPPPEPLAGGPMIRGPAVAAPAAAAGPTSAVDLSEKGVIGQKVRPCAPRVYARCPLRVRAPADAARARLVAGGFAQEDGRAGALSVGAAPGGGAR